MKESLDQVRELNYLMLTLKLPEVIYHITSPSNIHTLSSK